TKENSRVSSRMRFLAHFSAISTVALFAINTPAQNASTSLEGRLAKIESATVAAQSAGDNAWVLVSAALVLMMTGPGLALFYGGFVRKKNSLGQMMAELIFVAL